MRLPKSFAFLISAVIVTAPAYAIEEQQDQIPRTDIPTDGAPTNDGIRGGPPAGSSDFILLGIGAGISTDYAGADSYDFLPTPLVIGRYKGIDFATRGPGITVDFIRDKRGDKVDFILGPSFRFRFDRNNADNIDDIQVAALEELDIALEVGVTAGVKFNRILSGFDDISLMVDAQADVLGAHGGYVISPSLTYSTPFSAGIVARLSGGITYASDDFVDTYSSINAANSAASGLAQFTGAGGIRDWHTSLLIAYDLSGDVRDGGWGLFALGSYSRLLGDTARSPIVTETGSPNQLFGAIGIGYSF